MKQEECFDARFYKSVMWTCNNGGPKLETVNKRKTQIYKNIVINHYEIVLCDSGMWILLIQIM